MKIWRKNVILAKIESTYGTDSTPAGADAMLAFNGQFEPNVQTPVERRPLRPYLGNAARPIAGRHVTLSFEVEMAGAGAVDTAPPYGVLLRACGLAETINAATNVEYDPVSASFESATVYWNMDGVLHKMLGARGNLEIVYRAGQVPMYRFSLTGLHVDPSAVALPAADFSGFQKPLPATPTHSHTFTLDSYAAALRELTLDLANTVTYREYLTSEAVEIVDRQPSGQVIVEAPALGTKDYFAVAKAETLVALELVHGTAGGNIVQLDAGQVQLINPRYQEGDGGQDLVMDLNPTPSASGDDELKITTL